MYFFLWEFIKNCVFSSVGVQNEHQKHSATDNRMGASSRLVTDQQRLSSHTDNNHRQSTAYDRQQKHGAANNNGAAGSKPYARDNTQRKTPRQSEYDTSHMATCTTTASAMTANRVSMNNGSTSRHGRAGDAHEHEYRSRWDGNTAPQTTGRSMYGRTSGFDGNMDEYNCMIASRHRGHQNDSEGKHDFRVLLSLNLG